MRVFITGGTGLVGTPVVAELVAHGHTVTGLARSDRSADALRSAGAEPRRGALADLDVLRGAATSADGVVHLAFGSDYSSAEAIGQSMQEEGAAIATLREALAGSDKPLVVVSGTPWIPGRPSTEADPLPTEGLVGARGRVVGETLAVPGVRASAVRLPRTVHDGGKGGFAGLLTDLARSSGVSGVPGDGAQRWPAVHAKDAAVLFRLALEQARAGSEWHAVADEGDAVRDIAAVIGRRLGLPVEPLPLESFGPFGEIFATDQPSSSAVTRAALGWTPIHPSLLEDLELLQP